MFTGLFVPLITPLTVDGGVATDALEALAHAALDDGATGLVALGTTAEAATLTPTERRTVVDVCAEVSVARGTPLIVGAGSNSTADSVGALADLDPRATAALTVVPYYTRPSEDGVVEHFRRLAGESPVPLVIYHIPYRTGTTLGVETLRRLADIPNVAGFKHSPGGIEATTVAFMADLPDGVSVLGGDDLYAGPMMALGASGAILACANAATRAYAELLAVWRDGPGERARACHDRLAPLTLALLAEPNPVVLKAVLAASGRIPTRAVRLPLLEATELATAAALDALASADTSRDPRAPGDRRTAEPRSPGHPARCGS